MSPSKRRVWNGSLWKFPGLPDVIPPSTDSRPLLTIAVENATNANPSRLSMIGDSVFYGAAATGATPPKPINSIVGKVRALANTAYGSAGSGLVVPTNATRVNASYDPRFTFSGSVTDATSGFFNGSGWVIASGAYVQFTDSATAFDVWTTGGGTAQVDGGSDVALANGSQVVNAGTLGSHALRINGPTTLQAVQAQTANGKLVVDSISSNGKSAGQFQQTASLTLLDRLDPTLSVISLGLNDWQAGTSTSTYTGYLTTIVNRVRSNGGTPVIHIAPIPSSSLQPVDGPTWEDYRAAVTTLSVALGCMVIDHAYLWGPDYETGSAAGKYADVIHPSDNGAQDIANDIWSRLVGNSNKIVVGTGSKPVGTAAYAVPTNGTARFVSPSGNNANPGTESQPWKTFTYAAANITDGGTIVMREGIYHEGKNGIRSGDSNLNGFVGIPINAANVTIMNYPGEAVWFDGSEVIPSSSFVADGSWWSKSYTPLPRDPQFSFTAYTGTYPPPNNNWPAMDDPTADWTFINPAYPTASWPERAWINGVKLQQVYTLAQMGPGKTFFDAYNNKWYLPENPTGKEVRLTTLQVLFNQLGNNLTCLGFGVRNYATSNPQQAVIKTHRQTFKFENVWFEELSCRAVHGVGSTNVNSGADNALFKFVTVKNMGISGISGNEVSNWLFEDSYFTGTNDAHYNYAPATGAIRYASVYGSTVRRCKFVNNFGKDLWYDVDCQIIRTISNDFIGTEETSVVYELSRDIIDVNSRHINTGGSPIRWLDSEDIEIWNMSAVGFGVNRGWNGINCRVVNGNIDNRAPREAMRINYHDDRLGNKLPAWPTATRGYCPHKMKIRNCAIGNGNMQAIFSDEALGGTPSPPIEPWTIDGLDWDHNLFTVTTTGVTPYPFLARTVTASNTIGNAIWGSVAALRSGTTANPGGALELNGLQLADPVDSNGYVRSNIRTQADNAAEPLPQYIADMIGVPVGTRRMGAFERSN